MGLDTPGSRSLPRDGARSPERLAVSNLCAGEELRHEPARRARAGAGVGASRWTHSRRARTDRSNRSARRRRAAPRSRHRLQAQLAEGAAGLAGSGSRSAARRLSALRA